MLRARSLIVLALGIAAVTGCSAHEARIRFLNQVTLDSDIVRLRDVADLSKLDNVWRLRVADIVVARFPRASRTLDIPAARIAQVARSQVPALTDWMPSATANMVVHTTRLRAPDVVSDAIASDRPKPRCWRVREPLRPGEAVTAADVDSADCAVGDVLAAAFRYDHIARVVRADIELFSGDLVPAFPRVLLATARSGQPLEAVVRIGHVTVVRQVTAVQDGPGESGIFVRARDGPVFALANPVNRP